jgi:hypothetical protein
MISNIITYLFIGTCWVLILDIATNYLQSKNKFSSLEKVWVALIWPITFIIFVYHFIKTYLDGPN